MAKYTPRKEVLAKGKNRTLWITEEDPNLVIHQYNNDITKFDDPDKTESFEWKGALCNSINAGLCKFLKDAGIPIAFQELHSSNEFISSLCSMLPLEITFTHQVLECSSFFKRNPHILPGTVISPPIMQIFAKTKGGVLKNWQGKNILKDLPEEDPFILDQLLPWRLFHPKKPLFEKSANLNLIVYPSDLVGNSNLEDISKVGLKAIQLLIFFFLGQGYTLCDIKFEMGINLLKNELVIADVVDVDNFRLIHANGCHYDKQLFRNGAPLEVIKERYQIIADLVSSI